MNYQEKAIFEESSRENKAIRMSLTQTEDVFEGVLNCDSDEVNVIGDNCTVLPYSGQCSTDNDG